MQPCRPCRTTVRAGGYMFFAVEKNNPRFPRNLIHLLSHNAFPSLPCSFKHKHNVGRLNRVTPCVTPPAPQPRHRSHHNDCETPNYKPGGCAAIWRHQKSCSVAETLPEETQVWLAQRWDLISLESRFQCGCMTHITVEGKMGLCKATTRSF